MKDKKKHFISSWFCSSVFLSMFLMLSSSMHYAPAPYPAAMPQKNIATKPSAKKEIRKQYSKKKSSKKIKKYRLADFFKSLGTFLGIMGLLALVLSPMLFYLFFPHIVAWVLFLAGMVSASLLTIFFFLLMYGSQREFWLWLSGVSALGFLMCFVGLLLNLPLFASLSILGIVLLALLLALFN